MTQKDKDLLLRDLCARLPYGVKVLDVDEEIGIVKSIEYPSFYVKDDNGQFDDFYLSNDITEIKPYLRPMSSMTHSEYDEYLRIKTHGKPFEVIDWFNAHHIDYRKLIEKGLAIAVTDENNPYK